MDPGCEERELLGSLRGAASAGIPVQILLDANRALRPVPSVPGAIPGQQGRDVARTTTSAYSCFQVLAPFSSDVPNTDEGADGDHSFAAPNSGVYLLNVLPPLLQRVLPNLLSEIAGVFHIKVYLVDDEVILSGANLSREYFTTRIDRYLRLRQPDIVEFYSQLVHRLCQHGAVRYNPLLDGEHSTETLVKESPSVVYSRRRMLLRSLEQLFTTEVPPVPCNQNSDIVAYAIPTFQAPPRYFPTSNTISFPDHEQTLRNLLEAARLVAREDAMGCLTIRIATAYLNPTADFLDLLARCASVTWFLTAGPVSHGFAPKQQQQQQLSERERSHNVEDRSHGWTIPNVFRHAARRAVKQLGRLQLQQQKNQKESSSLATKKVAQVAFYQRPGWTFHAKGLWLSSDHNDKEDRNTVHGASLSTKGRDDWSGTGSGHDGSPSTLLTMPSSSRLIAVCTGSGNFGARSTSRDMESNLVLIFTSSSNRNPLARYHVDEWNHLCEYANTEELPTLLQSPRWIPFVFPFVRSFF